MPHDCAQPSRGLPKHEKSIAVTSSRVAKPRRVVAQLADVIDLTDDTKLRQLQAFIAKQRLSLRRNKLSLSATRPLHDMGGLRTFGGIRSRVEPLLFHNLLRKRAINSYNAFVIGEPIIDAVNHRIVISLSSEELLLNAYRNEAAGQRPWFAVDCTFRLSESADIGWMVVGTGDLGQRGFTIGIAIVNHEDQAAHEKALRDIKLAAEAIVRSRARRGLRV